MFPVATSRLSFPTLALVFTVILSLTVVLFKNTLTHDSTPSLIPLFSSSLLYLPSLFIIASTKSFSLSTSILPLRPHTHLIDSTTLTLSTEARSDTPSAAMTVDDNAMQKLWKLTNELTAQLVFNRNATLELKQQLADLQAKADMTIPVSGEVAFNSQEHADINLRIANERLVEENLQLQEQVKEYERWMEFIMTKFRLQNFAMAQTRKEAMHEAYRMAEQEGELAVRLQEENAMLQARLADVGVMARKVINEEYYNTESLIESLEMENQGLREMLGVASDNIHPHVPRHSGNRVSFPSTGSYMASSGSDREHGMTMPFSPSEETVPEDAIPSSSSLAPVEPTGGTFSSSASSLPSPTSTSSSTASNSTITSPVLRAETIDIVDLNKKPDEPRHKKKEPSTTPEVPKTSVRRNSGVGVGHGPSKGGMTINTNVGVKKPSTSTMSTLSSAQKTKKPNRKLKT